MVKNYLPTSFIRQQTDKLNNELTHLEKKVKELKDFPDFGTSSDDAAQEVAEFTADNEILQKSKIKIKEIKRALKTINQGTYGICSTCGEHILAGRLKVMPETITCVTHHKKS